MSLPFQHCLIRLLWGDEASSMATNDSLRHLVGIAQGVVGAPMPRMEFRRTVSPGPLEFCDVSDHTE